MDAPERVLLAETLARVTAETGDGSLDAALADLGWADALREDPGAAIAVLFRAQGTATATSSALDQVLGLALGVDPSAAVVLPALGQGHMPGRREGNEVMVRGLGTAALAGATTVVAALADEEGGVPGCHALTLDPASLVLRPVHGIDPALGLVEVSADVRGGPERGRALDPAAWDAALRWGRLAVGHELAGAGRTMLELARQHALTRVQFGRPIASFQAVRHRLAESLVALEAADALLAAAEDDRTATTTGMAKAFAGRAARTVAGHAQQVLAGIGFTTEHPLHRSVRRILVLDQLLGAGDALTRGLGTETLARQALPAALPL